MADKLVEMIKRRHPLYEEMVAHWNFCETTYDGGRGWFADNIFKYLKEGNTEFAERVKRAYRFNHTKQAVDLIDKYLFKMPVARRVDDAPEQLKAFWKRATLSGLDIDAYSKRVSRAASIFGRVWVVVDSNSLGGTASVAEEREAQSRIYSYWVRPQDALDMGYDDLDELTWIKIRELKRDDADWLESSGGFSRRYRIWTRQDWTLFEERQVRGKTVVEQIGYGEHGLGVVPVFPVDHNPSEERYAAPGLVDDIAYLDRANANYLSNLDAIIQDQSFSQLAMPAQGLMPGEKAYDKLIEMSTKRVFLYNVEAGAAPAFISPDPKQAELIITAIGKIINEIYHSVGLAAARTKEDNGGGIDNASGVAKAYDFEGVNALLAAKAGALEIFERRLAAMVAAWAVVALDSDKPLVEYPRDFDVRGLYDEFEIGARLSLLAAPDEVRRKQMRSVITKLFPGISDKELKELENSLKDWPPEPVEAEGALGSKDKAGGPLKAAGTQKTAKELAA